MARKRKGKAARNARRKKPTFNEPSEVINAPHTFVVHRGVVGKLLLQLKRDFKMVMEPYTATRLTVTKNNTIKDYIGVAGLLNVTNLISFAKSSLLPTVRICRFPRGPTLTFRINEFSLAHDVTAAQKKPVSTEKLFSHHPFLVLNNFSGEGMHIKLMATMLQNMFPSINVNSVNLNRVRRCVLFNYNSESNIIEFRHYAIKVVPCGLNRGVKKLLKKKVPNLSRFGDVTEIITKGWMLSDSEAELDGEHNEVDFTRKIRKRRKITQKRAIRLVELGPRLTLKLVKIEEGLMKGNVMYEEPSHKTSVKDKTEPVEAAKDETEPVEAKKAKLS